MKATDLRIGNIVTYGFDDEPIYPERVGKIYSINNNGCLIQLLRHKHDVAIGRIKPIPLTEEWLIKFGFVECSKGMYDYGDYTFNLEMCSLWDYTGDEGYLIATQIKYVHELQNLFYCLTKKELLITN
jgi:hypothetical protein